MDIIPTVEDLQNPRIPSDLRLFVARALHAISRNKAAKEETRLWLGRAKELMREILPMSYFAPWRWPNDDVLIQPQLGSQGYDAKILTLDGKPLTALEVSWAVDGKVHIENMIALNENGASIQTMDNNELDAAVNRTIIASQTKARNDYRDYLLLLVFDVLPLFYLEEDRHWKIIQDMYDQLVKMQFVASEVYLLLLPPDYVTSHGRDPIIRINNANKSLKPIAALRKNQ